MGGIFRNNLGSSADAGGPVSMWGKNWRYAIRLRGIIYTLVKHRACVRCWWWFAYMFFLFGFGPFVKNHQETGVFASGLMKKDGTPTSTKTKIRKSDLLHVTIFIFNIWNNHLENAFVSLAASGHFGHMTCAPSSLSSLPWQPFFSAISRGGRRPTCCKASWRTSNGKKRNWEETRV